MEYEFSVLKPTQASTPFHSWTTPLDIISRFSGGSASPGEKGSGGTFRLRGDLDKSKGFVWSR